MTHVTTKEERDFKKSTKMTTLLAKFYILCQIVSKKLVN